VPRQVVVVLLLLVLWWWLRAWQQLMHQAGGRQLQQRP
jgi:hypothetical protein